uniref:Uncharacterized protein n=1 Tax=Anguilla anguilla TaxID=7936 RepID=A0A0E9PDV1_ANGAN
MAAATPYTFSTLRWPSGTNPSSMETALPLDPGTQRVYFRGRSSCFGGWDTPVRFNDMHMLDLGLMEFSPVKTNGTPPSPRSWHGCAVLSDS